MLMADSIRRDQYVDRVPDRPPAGAELAVVPCRLDRGPRVRHRNRLELVEGRFDGARGTLVAHALQHLDDGDRGETEPLSIEAKVEPLRLRIGKAVQVINEDAGVDDHQGSAVIVVGARRPEVSLPLHLAAQPAQGALPARLDQQAQAFLYGGTLGSRSGATQRLCHQLIVDLYVGSHGNVYIFTFYVYGVKLEQSRSLATAYGLFPVSRAQILGIQLDRFQYTGAVVSGADSTGATWLRRGCGIAERVSRPTSS